jgi:hypothetical protein
VSKRVICPPRRANRLKRQFNLLERSTSALDLQFAGNDARNIQQVINQLRLRTGIAFDGVARA